MKRDGDAEEEPLVEEVDDVIEVDMLDARSRQYVAKLRNGSSVQVMSLLRP